MDLRKLQEELKPWVLHNFGYRPSWQPLLGIQEEVGELSHAYLKRAQGIRKGENHEEAMKDAAADIIVFLCDFCNAENIDLASTLQEVWNKVSKRDWKVNPVTGTQS
jgi:NTP pyrophosphatase (non-canonical NTP hydrolase)